MVEAEKVQILMGFGLTLLQAKVYLALCKTGTATVKKIYNTSDIARQDIYRIMPTLQELGLVEKILSTPTMYKPTPIKDGYNLLLQKQTNEHINLRNKTLALIKSLKKSNNETRFEYDDSQFIMTVSKNLRFQRISEGIGKAQISIDFIVKQRIFGQMVIKRFSLLKRSIKMGVKIRVLTERLDGDNLIEKIIQPLNSNNLFEIRYHNTQTDPVVLTIYDKKKVDLCLATSIGSNGVPSLWTNNPRFLKIINTYFEELWKKNK